MGEFWRVAGPLSLQALRLNCCALLQVYLFMGIVIGSAVVPIATVLTWNAPGPKTVTCALLMGFLSAVISWLATAGALNDGEISVSTTGDNVP